MMHGNTKIKKKKVLSSSSCTVGCTAIRVYWNVLQLLRMFVVGRQFDSSSPLWCAKCIWWTQLPPIPFTCEERRNNCHSSKVADITNCTARRTQCRMKANESKSVQATFTLNKISRQPVKLNNDHLPQADEVKYIGIHLDRRLIWRKHITTKRK